ncbi:hypothetical protein WMY93_031978 [Mugilogobius chulae]|uniref:PCI domain-containing protein n=1 Tax=Mugilogobius chulae TaxID=88201 RepID=A0AAW0MCT7_9GOBI
MKETAAKRRDKASAREKKEQKETKGPEPQDVDMPEEEAPAAVTAGEQDGLTLEDIKEHVKQIEKAVQGKEPRFVLRALRALPSISRRLNANVLHKTICGFYTSNASAREYLLGFVQEPMEMSDGDVQFRPRSGKAASVPLLPEVEAFLQLLLVIHLCNSKNYSQAQKVSDDLMQKICSKNRRALDLVAAKCFYYHARVYEFSNSCTRSAGRIKAIQLEYSEARRTLTNALRKAPQHTAVHKLLIVVELLLGEIPDRLQFRQPSLKRSLHPYFLLTQAVRTGNLSKFNQVLEQFGEKFQTDGTYTLIIRLRHNVIKTVWCSCAFQAIRDGVIEASINHEKGFVQSKETMTFTQPENLSWPFTRESPSPGIHNMSVKAMRFPPKAYNKDLESAEERREREQQDLEFAKEMAEDDDDSFP